MNKPIKTSPREQRLLDAVNGSWVTSHKLCEVEFGRNQSRWPINARIMVTGAMTKLMRKIDFNHVKIRIDKRGGGRGGVEYRRS